MGILLRGYISNDGFWRIDAKLHYNGKTDPTIINFMIDSGAQATILSPFTAKNMGIGFDALADSREIDIGGPGMCKGRELPDANIIFHIEKETEDLMIPCHNMYVADPKCWRMDFSIIGQDVLKQFNVIVNNEKRTIDLVFFENTFILVQRKE